MMGGGLAEATYIINNAGEKLHTNVEKELESNTSGKIFSE